MEDQAKQRSEQKQISKEALILRHMRLSRNLSLNNAGRRLGISGSAIAHIEQGRMDLSRKRIATMIEAYEYTTSDYLEFFDGKEVPRNLRDECLFLLRSCDESKVKMLYPIIISVAN
jgi:transcriptional regulator with XRE-family HTH domain